MKLFEELKECRKNRENYKIEFAIKFIIDNTDYCMSFIPTILWQPWIYRYPNEVGIIDIWWFNFHISIGKWVNVGD